MSDGIRHLGYDEDGLTIEITKLRGSSFPIGRHSIRNADNDLEVFPRLIPEDYDRPFAAESLSFEVTALDELLPGEREGTENEAKFVMIDGIDGYQHLSRRGDRGITRELHSLGRHLTNRCVITLLVNEVNQVTGQFQATERNVSSPADNLVFQRDIAFQGELQKTLGVLEKRTSDYERALRQLKVTEHGLKVGEPPTELRGILTGAPHWACNDPSEHTIGRDGG